MDRQYKFHWLGHKALEQFNKALEEEAAGWVTIEKPEASGPTEPFDHTKINYLGDNWNKPKLNNGDKKH